MDLVEQAGIDVAPWAVKKDGKPVSHPRANPNYCYEWAFGGDGEPTVLCVWHSLLKATSGSIAYEDSMRQHALKLDAVGIDRHSPAHVRSRARDQAKRGQKFDSLLQRAFRRGEQVRVILLQGDQREAAAVGWDTAEVRYRKLDESPWHVEFYRDNDGAFRLVRGELMRQHGGRQQGERCKDDVPARGQGHESSF